MNQQHLARIALAIILSITLNIQPAQAADPVIRRVIPGGETNPTCGGGWNAADPAPAMRPCDLQTALDASAPGDAVWAAAGTYLPTWRSDPGDPRSATFRLPDGVAVYGGFAGDETALAQRNWRKQVSLLSGDLDHNDGYYPATDAKEIQGANAYHVVDASGTGAATVLDGFSIAGGDATGPAGILCSAECGGGVNAVNSSLTLANLRITGSRAANQGGGLYLSGPGSPTLSDVYIRGGQAHTGGGAFFRQVTASLEDVVIEVNIAEHGAGLAVFGGEVRIDGALFGANDAIGNPASEGGALLLDQSAQASFTNTTFHGNYAVFGALAGLRGNSSLFLTHITAVQNYANTILNGGIFSTSSDASFSIHDSIVYYNSQQVYSGSPPAQALISNTMLMYCQDGVICTDLIPPEEHDVTFGGFTPFVTTAGYPLLIASTLIDRAPCLDRSTEPATPITRDQRGSARAYGEACDLGALEFSPRVIYVNHAAAGDGSGTSWENAFPGLVSATITAAPGDQIWVAAGTYYPTDLEGLIDRGVSFTLRQDVEVYGGFAGNETALEQRDFLANETILSGNIDHDQPIPTGNTYHVLFSDNSNRDFLTPFVTEASVLDGFTITGGVADGEGREGQGGGLYINGDTPTLRNLTIRGNSAVQGGGMYNNGFTRLINVLFLDNEAVYGGGLANGQGPLPGPYASSQSQAILNNVTFTGNTADYGGAIANRGALSLYVPGYVSQPDLMHVTIYGNTARQQGGAIYMTREPRYDIHHVIMGSILWNNGENPLYAGEGASYRIQNAIVEGGCPAGADCINVSAEDPQLGPLGAAKGGPPTFPLLRGSPAIDANPAAECTDIIFTGTFTNERVPLTFDQRGAPRPFGSACDLGAHEYQAELSILSGDNQRTDALLPFPEPLVVGPGPWGDAIEGLEVNFMVQAGDAGGQISSTTATVSGGQASVNATAKLARGFSVRASAPGFNSVYFHLRVNDTSVDLAASPNPAAYGQQVTLSARVWPRLFGINPHPTGTVTFMEGETVLGVVDLPVLSLEDPPQPVALALSNLPVGTHHLRAVYSGSDVYHDVTTSPVVELTITGGSELAQVILSGLEKTYTGSPHLVMARTIPPGLPVTVTYDGQPDPPVDAGQYAVMAVVSDASYSGSASDTLEIGKASLTVQAVSASRPFGAPNPTVAVQYSGFVNDENEAVLSGAPLLGPLPARSALPDRYPVSITAGSLQAANYEFKLLPGELVITRASTRLTLEVAPAAVRPFQPLALTARVTPQNDPLPVGIHFAGTVIFRVDDGSPVEISPGADGTAVYTLPGLSPGAHYITVDYTGDANYLGESIAPLNLQVNGVVVFLPLVVR